MQQNESNEQHHQRLLSNAATLLVMRYLNDLVEDGVSRQGLEIAFLTEYEKPENQNIPLLNILNIVRTKYGKEAR